MKIQNVKKAFTLIELLVVITIIGILATGATTVYTSQIQKARDATRLNDIKALQAWIEQDYQDNWVYPDKWSAFSWVTVYVPSLPQDPKTGEASGNSVFDYLYSVSDDANTIDNQEYEVSTHFEQEGNITSKAEADGWDDDYRWEAWIDIDDATDKPTVVSIAGWISGWTLYSCYTPTWSAGSCATAADPMLIINN